MIERGHRSNCSLKMLKTVLAYGAPIKPRSLKRVVTYKPADKPDIARFIEYLEATPEIEWNIEWNDVGYRFNVAKRVFEKRDDRLTDMTESLERIVEASLNTSATCSAMD